jgi:hypothetical protein
MPNKGRLLELALKGLEAERARIDDEIIQLGKRLGGRVASAVGLTVVRPKRTMSAAARRKISLAMKRSHAERKRAVRPQGRQRTGLTLAGRKKLSEMMKARWAAKKKAGRKAA